MSQDRGAEESHGFVCILHAVIGDVAVLSFLSVLRITNLRVFNTCAGSTPAASTTFIFNNLIRLSRLKSI